MSTARLQSPRQPLSALICRSLSPSGALLSGIGAREADLLRAFDAGPFAPKLPAPRRSAACARSLGSSGPRVRDPLLLGGRDSRGERGGEMKAVSTHPGAAAERIHYLDNLRAFA